MAPSWAEVVGRGGILPPAGRTNSSPPPAGHCHSPTLVHLLKLYRGCKMEGRWARLTLETFEGEEELSFCCRSSSTSAAATVSPSNVTGTRRRGRKRPPNEKRREKERRRRKQQLEKKREGASAGAASPGAAQLAAATPSAAACAAATVAAATVAAPRAAQLAAAKPSAAACAAATLAAAELAASTPDIAAHAAAMHAVVTPTPARREAAVSTAASLAAATPTTAGAVLAAIAGEKVIAVEAAARPEGAATAALRELSKMAAFERRASSRSLVLARRSKDSQPGTPENLRCAEEEALNFDISMDLEDRESVFSPAQGDKEMEPVKWASAEKPLLVLKKVELMNRRRGRLRRIWRN